MEKFELRVLSSNISTNDDEMIVEGLVNKTGEWSHTLGLNKRFREKIGKGVFTRSIDNTNRIDFLGEHNTDLLLATTENGSLQLWEDNEGLKMRAKIAPTSYGKDFYTLMKEKLVNHMSFGFKVVKDDWKKATDGIYERTVSELELKEVSVVRNPAYPQSAIAARGIDVVEDVEIPVDLEDEERSIDIEALKAEIKKEVLAEISAPKVEQENKPEEKQEDVKPVEPEKQPDPQPETKEEPKVEEKVEEKVEVKEEPKAEEPKVEEPKVEEQKPDTSANLMDLLQKYKKLQGYK